MTPEQFTYWLQGFIEVEDPTSFSKKQTQQIKDHLKLVFDKQTPERNKKKEKIIPQIKYVHTGVRRYC